MLNLYHVSQRGSNEYDTYSSCVVAANSEEEARTIHPNGRDKDWYKEVDYEEDSFFTDPLLECWDIPSYLKVRLIGKAEPEVQLGVIVASFHAG